METLLAERTKQMGINAIREILKVVGAPGMVSLAGGIPAPESFPIELMRRLTDTVLSRFGAAALQYDPTEGFGPLREVLADYLAQGGIRVRPDGVVVTSGSQSALDLLGMVMLTKGDRVAVEAPTYIGALQAFRPYEPEFVAIETDDEGPIPDSLAAVLRTRDIKMVYLVSTFQNPTGCTIALERRKAIARLIRENNVLLVEDDPYSALRYDGDPLPPIQTLAPDHVAYVGTLSKVFAPGLRIGYCVAPEVIQRWLVVAKQGVDLHTSTYNQALAAVYIDGGHMAEHMPKIIDLYRPRRDAMLDALTRCMPASYSWSIPQGGMFVWVRGPDGTDMPRCYHQAVARGVAFVPGTFFYPEPGSGLETARLNFTMSDEKILGRAVAVLGEVFTEAIPRHWNRYIHQYQGQGVQQKSLHRQHHRK